MTVDPSGSIREYTVEGTTFSPNGSVYSADGKRASAELQSDPIQRLAEIASLCNDAKIVYNSVSTLPPSLTNSVLRYFAGQRSVFKRWRTD